MKKFFLALSLFLFLSACVSTEKNIKKAELYHKKGISLMQKCQYPLALSKLKKALDLKNDRPLFHYSIALLYFQFKKYDKTIWHFKKALKLEPKFTAARVHLGRTLIEKGSLKQAVMELKKAKDDLSYNHPEDIHAHLGLAYYKQKKYKEAVKHLSVASAVKKKHLLSFALSGPRFV